MDKLAKYSQFVQDILGEYSKEKPALEGLEYQAIFDTERGHYQVVQFGWEERRYVHYCLIHVDIKPDKIWVQWNMTEINIPGELVEMGVPKQDIVVGFHHPFMRKFTDYAVG